MSKSFLLKTLGLFGLFPVLYVIHIFLLLPLFDQVEKDFIDFSYLYNFLTTFLIVQIIIGISFYSKEFLGFIFLLMSPVKLMLFIYMSNKYGFQLERTVFLQFFLPYLIGLIIELYLIIQLLKDSNPKETK